jgi:pyruvate formate lyase activating enzyme
MDIASEARGRGVRCVSGTAAYVNKRPIRDACRVIDAFAVTLKGFDEAFYEKVCGISLKPVLAAIEEIKSEGAWLELTTLIVPTYNDDIAKVKEMARWIRKNLGTRVPWHFARFVPRYRLKNIPQTPVQTLADARNAALDEGLEFVYTSNVAPHEGNNTCCPRCGRLLIERVGFKTLDNHIKKGRCPCGHEIAGVFEKQPRTRF